MVQQRQRLLWAPCSSAPGRQRSHQALHSLHLQRC
jgi:hypothetical protein